VDTLHENKYTFLITSRPVLLRMRNVSDKVCRENQNTHFTLRTFSPKILQFMKPCEKMWYNQTGHRWPTI